MTGRQCPHRTGRPWHVSGPSHSPHTASALRSERRTRLRRLRTAGAAVPAVVAAGVLGLTSGGDDAQSKRRPVAVRQAPDDIRETVEKAPDSPEAAGPPTSSKRPRPWAGTSRPSVPGRRRGSSRGHRGLRPGVHPRGREQGAVRARRPHPTVRGEAPRRRGRLDGRRPPRPEPRSGRGPHHQGHEPALRPPRGLRCRHGQEEVGREAAGRGSAMSVNVTVTDGAVLGTRGQGSAAYDMTTGKRLWADTTPSACEDSGFAGGKGLIALQQRGDAGDPEYRVRRSTPARAGRSGPTRSPRASTGST